MGDDGFGAYLLTMGWLSVALAIGSLELDTTSVRFVGSYAATGSWELLRGYLRGSRTAVLVASLTLGALGALVVALFPASLEQKHPDFASALLVACILLPVASLLLLEGSFLQGLQRYTQAQVPPNVIRPIVFGIAFVSLAFIAPRFTTPPAAVAANLVGASVALGLAWVWRWKELPAVVRASPPKYDTRTWMRTAAPLFAVSLAQLVISYQSDVIIVGTMLDIEDVAHYGAASQLTLPLVMAASSIIFVAQPMIAELHARGETARLQSLIRAVSLATAAVGVPLAIGLIALAPWLLAIWGPEFVVARPVLVILTLAQLVAGLVGALAGYLLTMTEHEWTAAWIIGLSAVLNIVLAVVLTRMLGPEGTALATLIAAIARAAALGIYIRRTMGLRVPAFGP
jgi:O-antigen/teichoic acid export membrane protein